MRTSALAFLAVTRAALAHDRGTPANSADEIRLMFTALCAPPRDEQHARHWSRWRHRHQERARQGPPRRTIDMPTTDLYISKFMPNFT
jgi:hypothetical protein